jgi:hypothetical protein
MANKHISLVQRWIAGEHISQEELEASRRSALDTSATAGASLADYAASLAIAQVAHADISASDSDIANAATRWIKKYEEMTEE